MHRRRTIRSALPVALVIAGLVSVSLPLSMPLTSRPAEAAVRLPEFIPAPEEIVRELGVLLDRAPGRVSLVIESPDEGWSIEHDPDRVVRAASVIKLPVMTAVMAIVERAGTSLDESITLIPADYTGGSGRLENERPRQPLTLRELIERMIVESDNTATNTLIRRFGREEIDREFRKMGFESTRLERRILDGSGDNPTTAREMARLLRALVNPENAAPAASGRIDPGSSPETILWMRSVLARAENRRRLARHLPPETTFEHKTGTLHDVCHDVGILRVQSGEIIISALLVGAAPAQAERWLGALGRLAFRGAGAPDGIRIATADEERPWYSR